MNGESSNLHQGSTVHPEKLKPATLANRTGPSFGVCDIELKLNTYVINSWKINFPIVMKNEDAMTEEQS